MKPMSSIFTNDPSLIPLNVISVCCKTAQKGYNENEIFIKRCADILNGELVPFKKNKKFTARHSNRIFFSVSNDAPELQRPWGIWDLSTVSIDEERDYAKARYHKGSVPIIVHRLSAQVPILDQLTSSVLAERFDYQFPLPVLFTYRVGNKLVGIHIRPDQVEKDGNGAFRLCNIWSLPQYELDETAIIQLDGATGPAMFWRFLSIESHAKVLDKRLYVTPPILALAEAIGDNYGSWKQFQLTFAGEKRDHKIFNSLMELLKKPDLLWKLNAHYHMSTEEFELIKKELTARAEEYFSGLDIESDVLLNSCFRHPEMGKKLREAAELKWKTEHQQDLTSAKLELESIKDSIEKSRNILKQLADQISAEEMRLRNAKTQYSKEEAMAQAVISKLTDNLQGAKSKVVDLLVDLPFMLAFQQVLSLPTKLDVSGDDFPNQNNRLHQKLSIEKDEIAESQKRERNCSGTMPNSEEGKVLSDNKRENTWTKVVEIPRPKCQISAAENTLDWVHSTAVMLNSAGIGKIYAKGLAKLAAVTSLQGTPLLLAGPNSCAIIRMLALALTGLPPVVVNLDEVPLEEALVAIDEWPEQVSYSPIPPVVLFRNAMSGTRLSTLLDDWRICKCTPVIATTFAEEIALYPSALLNSVFPVLTELFLNEDFRPRMNPKCMKCANVDLIEQWRQQSHTNSESAVPDAIERVPLLPLARRRHEALIAQADRLFEDLSSQDVSETFLLCIATAVVLLSPSPMETGSKIKKELLPLLSDESATALRDWLDGLHPEETIEVGATS